MAPDSQPPAAHMARAAVGLFGLGLLGLGQFWLLLGQQPAAGPLLLIVGGLAVFLFALLAQPAVWARRPWRALRIPRLGLAVAASLALSAGATALAGAYQVANRANYLPVLVLWFAGMITYLAGFSSSPVRLEWRAWFERHGREALALAVVVVVGAWLRFYRLGAIPRVINGDEGLLGQAALLTSQPGLANPYVLFENFGSLYLQGMALAMEFLGATPFALRLLPALAGTGALVAVYVFTRHLFGPRAALFAAILLAVSHAHIHFSRTVAVGYIQGTLLIPLELYFFHSGLTQRSAARTAVGGLLLGLHFNVYLSAQIIAALIVVYLALAALLCRPLIQRAWRPVLAFWGALLVAGLPAFVQAVRAPEAFMDRLNADGTLQSGWLADEVARTGQNAVVVLAGRVSHAFLSLNFYPASDFYGARIPLLDVITSCLFIVGVAVALWRTRASSHLLLNGWFWAATVSIGVFSIPASADSYRMLIALPAALVLAALGLEAILTIVTQPSAARVRVGLAAGLLAAVAVLNVRAYFFDFAAQCRYGGDVQTRFASYLGSFLRTVDREADVFLLSDDVLQYGTHSSVDFLSAGLPVLNVPEPVSTLALEPNTAIIAIADRADELRAWARANPGGHLERYYDCDNLMLAAYVIPEN